MGYYPFLSTVQAWQEWKKLVGSSFSKVPASLLALLTNYVGLPEASPCISLRHSLLY